MGWLILMLVIVGVTTAVQVGIAVRRRIYQGRHRVDSRLVERVPWPTS